MKKSDFQSSLGRIEALPRERREKIETGAARVLKGVYLWVIERELDAVRWALAS